MSYFKNFPTIDYDVNGDGMTQTVTDILNRLAIRQSVRDNSALFSKVDVMDWDTPESLSYEIYGYSEYHWVIMMMNKCYDRYYEWPMSQRNLQRYVIDKYADPNGIHHYEISQSSGNTTKKIKVELADEPTATPITNIEYETEENDKRKQILVLDPGFLGTFLGDWRTVLSNQRIKYTVIL